MTREQLREFFELIGTVEDRLTILIKSFVDTTADNIRDAHLVSVNDKDIEICYKNDDDDEWLSIPIAVFTGEQSIESWNEDVLKWRERRRVENARKHQEYTERHERGLLAELKAKYETSEAGPRVSTNDQVLAGVHAFSPAFGNRDYCLHCGAPKSEHKE